MDERQAQIKEGEGLTESRVNQDFLEFLQKWGMHALLVVALIFLAYRGWQWLEQRRVSHIGEAFRQLEAAGAASEASPSSLLQIAEDFKGVRGVPYLARLKAADAWMVAIRRGVHPGAVVLTDGSLENPDDLLDDDARALYLDNASREYRAVRTQAAGDAKLSIYEINALYGLAAVEESRGDYDAAKGYYEELRQVAQAAGLTPHPTIAQERIDSIDEIQNAPELYAKADLPILPWNVPEEEPETPDDAGQGEDAGDEGADEAGAVPPDDAEGAGEADNDAGGEDEGAEDDGGDAGEDAGEGAEDDGGDAGEDAGEGGEDDDGDAGKDAGEGGEDVGGG